MKFRLTEFTLKELCPTSKANITEPFTRYFNKYADKYGVNTFLRLTHFLAQAAHESAHFRTLEEYATGEDYEGRKDLGNTRKGDGVRYKGRGVFQLTGRHNYRKFGKILDLDLENNPELAATPEVSVLTALEYWKDRKLNDLADKDMIRKITRRINGWYNGFEDRLRYLEKAKRIIKYP